MAQALSVLTLLAGDWDAARRHAREYVALVEEGAEEWRDRAVMAMSRIHAADGDLAAARAMAEPAAVAQEAAGDRWEGVIFRSLLGFVELSAGDAEAALAHLTKAADHADAIEVRLPTQFRFLGDLAEAAVLAGQVDLAETVVAQRLDAAARRQPLPWTIAMAHRGRGLVALGRGAGVAAIASLDAALAVYDQPLPMPFERARTLYVRARAHRRAGHRRAARHDLTEAAARFDGLGARAWLRLADEELGRIGGRTAERGQLTGAELEVARRAAAGRSNREIAAELSISPPTVESHLSAVYRKLGVRSRGQLGRAMFP